MSEEIHLGDHVEYQAVGGNAKGARSSTTTGMVKDILTEPRPAGSTGVRVKASEEEPRVVIENDNTGKETAYKEESVIGIIRK